MKWILCAFICSLYIIDSVWEPPRPKKNFRPESVVMTINIDPMTTSSAPCGVEWGGK